jgi:hypothetical protein
MGVMANQNSDQTGQEGAAAAFSGPATADPGLFDELAAAGVVLREDGDDGPVADDPAAPAADPAAPAEPAPAGSEAPAGDPAPADPAATATASERAAARKILATATRRSKQEAAARAKLVADLRTNPSETLRALGIEPRTLITGLNPEDAVEPAEPTTDDRVKKLEEARAEDARRQAAERARQEREQEEVGFEKSKLATIEAVKNARVAGAGGKQVEAYPRINHTGSHELVVELMLGYAERHSPKDAEGNIVPDTLVTLPREKAAERVEKYLADMGVPVAKVAAPAVRPGARPAAAAPAPARTPVGSPQPVITARDGGASYEGPSEEIADEDARRTATFRELGFELN